MTMHIIKVMFLEIKMLSIQNIKYRENETDRKTKQYYNKFINATSIAKTYSMKLKLTFIKTDTTQKIF